MVGKHKMLPNLTPKNRKPIMSLNIPVEFQDFADEIIASCKPCAPFTLTATPTQLWDSKVGGKPYLPRDFAYPNNPDGEPLFFLAQINFAQMPALSDFPSKGILQFFIDGKDDCYGINFDDYTDNSRYKLIYHADVVENADELQQDFDFVQFDEDDYGIPFPASHSYQIHFQAATPQPITRHDFAFGEVVPELSGFLDEKSSAKNDDWDLHRQYDIFSGDEVHRVGGYPYFTQDDVRGYGSSDLKDYVLLFQLVSDWRDSNDDVNIMWGDCGVGNFFIRPDDLKNLAFDKAFFTMDCC